MGNAEPCSVREEEIGMYRDLPFVILCDKGTASAAEVFTAALRDYGLPRKIIGETTFGKGILQTTYPIRHGNLRGYLKLTTHTYVTKCGETYHGTGITPSSEVPRKEGTEDVPLDELPEADDNQLLTAIRYLIEQGFD